jgi:hypothetical protein
MHQSKSVAMLKRQTTIRDSAWHLCISAVVIIPTVFLQMQINKQFLATVTYHCWNRGQPDESIQCCHSATWLTRTPHNITKQQPSQSFIIQDTMGVWGRSREEPFGERRCSVCRLTADNVKWNPLRWLTGWSNPICVLTMWSVVRMPDWWFCCTNFDSQLFN